MQIIKDQQIVENEWFHADEMAEQPAGKVTIPFSRWQEQRADLIDHTHLGIRLTTSDSVTDIIADLKYFELIAIVFEKFNDGRGYTQARLLRERFGFKGEIRAVGNILRDQLYYLMRCGFNAFEFGNDENLENALQAFTAYSISAQPDVFKNQDGIGPWRYI